MGLGGDDVIYGGNSGDCLVGGDGNDRLYGGTAKDILIGDNGDDQLDGGNGKDYLDGGDGVDECLGGNGKDTLTACESTAAPAATLLAPATTTTTDSKTDSTSGTRRPAMAATPMSLSIPSDRGSPLARLDSPPPSMLRLKLTATTAPPGQHGSGVLSPYPTRSRAIIGSGVQSGMGRPFAGGDGRAGTGLMPRDG